MWTVLGAVEQMDLARFYGAYRANGQGRAAYDPAMVVALLLYSYAVGLRSSRQIERACRGDVAFKVITAMAVPDHSTVAEFRRRHEADIEELFDDVLRLCREAGLVSVGVITIAGRRSRGTRRWIRTAPTAVSSPTGSGPSHEETPLGLDFHPCSSSTPTGSPTRPDTGRPANW